MFGFERKIMIHFSNLEYAGLKRTTSIVLRSACELKRNRNSISNRRSSGKDNGEGNNQDGDEEIQKKLEEHVFRSFDDRQSVLNTILDAYSKLNGRSLPNNETKDPEGNQADDNHVFSPLRKRNFSDGSYFAKKYFRNKAVDGAEGEDEDEVMPLERSFQVGSAHGRDLIRAFNQANELNLPKRRSPENQDIAETGMDESIHTQSQPPMVPEITESSSQHSIPSVSMDEWKIIKKRFREQYPQTAVEFTLPISLSEFHKLFVKDEASFSMAWFQQHYIQDDDVSCTPWTKESNVSNPKEGDEKTSSEEVAEGEVQYYYVRHITSQHKRKAKIGPARVSLERKQRYYHDSKGIVINTEIITRGVPYEKNFVLEDQWIIEETEGDIDLPEGKKSISRTTETETSPSVSVEVRFRVQFIKSTMNLVKKVILDQTKKELNSWFERYVSMIHSRLKSDTNQALEVNVDHGGKYSATYAESGEKGLIPWCISLLRYVFGSFSSPDTIIHVSYPYFAASVIFFLITTLVTLYISLTKRISLLESMLVDIIVQNEVMLEKLDNTFTSGSCQEQI